MATETDGRFINISDEEVNKFCEQQENENTKKKTLYDLNIFKVFLSS